MFSELFCCFEFFKQKRPFQPATDLFSLLGLLCIVACSSRHIIEDPYQITNVLLHVLFPGPRPVKHIRQFKIKAETIPSHYDVLRVEISMIFSKLVNSFNSFGECVQQVNSLERTEPLARLLL